MRIGAHVSTAGGLDLAIDRAAEIGAEAVQVFCSAPQRWAFKTVDELIATKFKTKAKENEYIWFEHWGYPFSQVD
jgi:deoxyribonuclease IV